MSVIIRLQNLPWSANALDIRNYFRGLSIPEGGVHIVGGELGDAFIAFSTDEDARQAMMMDCGRIKEIQVKLLLSSRSEMHKVIEAARQSVPILTLTAPAPVVQPPAPVIVQPPAPVALQQPVSVVPSITPFAAALGASALSGYSIPGIGNPQEIPQPAVIEPPAPMISPPIITPEDDDDKSEKRRSKEKDRRRSRTRSRSRDRDRKERKRDRRDRSRSRERRRRDRSRSRERRDRKRDRKERSRSRERSPTRRSRDRRNERRSPTQESSQEDNTPVAGFHTATPPQVTPNQILQNGPTAQDNNSRFSDPALMETFNKLQELGKKRNPNAFQGEVQNGGGGARFSGQRGGVARGGFRRDNGRPSRFDEQQTDCCVAIRNAPNHTSYGDVRRFFPFMIDKHGIKMINDNMGRRTGNIYVRFCDTRSKQMALQRRSNELKGAQVSVEALDDDAYDAAVDSFLPYRDENEDAEPAPANDDRPPFTVIKLTELPHFVKEHDIIKAFSEFSLLSIMVNDCRVSRSKIAYVQFVKPEDARTALNSKDKYIFGRRHATLAPLTDEEYEAEKVPQTDKITDKATPGEKQTPAPQPEHVGPRDPRQRRQFDNGGAQNQQTPTGAAAPFFGGGFPAQQNIFPGPQFPAGFPNPGAMDPRTAAANWANRPAFAAQLAPRPLLQNPTPVDVDEEPLDCVLMKGLPRDATDRTIVTFLSDTGAVPARIHLMLDTGGLPSGDCFCEFRSAQEARQAATKHGGNIDGCRITIDPVARGVVEEALEGPRPSEPSQPAPPQAPLLAGPPAPYFDMQSRGFARGGFRGRGAFRGGIDRGGFDGGRGSFRGRGNWNERGRFDRGRGRGMMRGGRGFENGREPRPEDEQDPALDNFGAPGCVVSMENVPFRASVDDIMDFFAGFELSQDDVIRRYNERGQPTGDARVAFRTPFDAQRAVKTRHMDTIHERRISLALL